MGMNVLRSPGQVAAFPAPNEGFCIIPLIFAP